MLRKDIVILLARAEAPAFPLLRTPWKIAKTFENMATVQPAVTLQEPELVKFKTCTKCKYLLQTSRG